MTMSGSKSWHDALEQYTNSYPLVTSSNSTYSNRVSVQHSPNLQNINNTKSIDHTTEECENVLMSADEMFDMYYHSDLLEDFSYIIDNYTPKTCNVTPLMLLHFFDSLFDKSAVISANTGLYSQSSDYLAEEE